MVSGTAAKKSYTDKIRRPVFRHMDPEAVETIGLRRLFRRAETLRNSMCWLVTHLTAGFANDAKGEVDIEAQNSSGSMCTLRCWWHRVMRKQHPSVGPYVPVAQDSKSSISSTVVGEPWLKPVELHELEASNPMLVPVRIPGSWPGPTLRSRPNIIAEGLAPGPAIVPEISSAVRSGTPASSPIKGEQERFTFGLPINSVGEFAVRTADVGTPSQLGCGPSELSNVAIGGTRTRPLRRCISMVSERKLSSLTEQRPTQTTPVTCTVSRDGSSTSDTSTAVETMTRSPTPTNGYHELRGRIEEFDFTSLVDISIIVQTQDARIKTDMTCNNLLNIHFDLARLYVIWRDVAAETPLSSVPNTFEPWDELGQAHTAMLCRHMLCGLDAHCTWFGHVANSRDKSDQVSFKSYWENFDRKLEGLEKLDYDDMASQVEIILSQYLGLEQTTAKTLNVPADQESEGPAQQQSSQPAPSDKKGVASDPQCIAVKPTKASLARARLPLVRNVTTAPPKRHLRYKTVPRKPINSSTSRKKDPVVTKPSSLSIRHESARLSQEPGWFSAVDLQAKESKTPASRSPQKTSPGMHTARSKQGTSSNCQETGWFTALELKTEERNSPELPIPQPKTPVKNMEKTVGHNNEVVSEVTTSPVTSHYECIRQGLIAIKHGVSRKGNFYGPANPGPKSASARVKLPPAFPPSSLWDRSPPMFESTRLPLKVGGSWPTRSLERRALFEDDSEQETQLSPKCGLELRTSDHEHSTGTKSPRNADAGSVDESPVLDEAGDELDSIASDHEVWFEASDAGVVDAELW
jgi:hypothetical protein